MRTSFTVGDMTIHRIVEQEQGFTPMLEFLPSLSQETLDENLPWLAPGGYNRDTGNVVLCFQSYVVRTPHHNILVDACIGNDKTFPLRPTWNKKKDSNWMQALKAAGLGVEDIDFVMCTHLHTDHVGWNTRLENGRWVPTFPKARYVFADRELAYWTKRQKDDPAACPWVTDSVLPVVAANRVDIVKSAHAFNDLVTLIPTPGHTIDHYSVRVGKPGADAIITGDMIHSPLQARYPELGMMSDYDSGQAGQSRRELFGRFCDTPTLLCTAHFPSPSTGRVVRRRDAFEIVDS
jgi:glyoxylase-like metal-dependent hydrolase (beta-lactamase superfamily II)